MGSAGLYSELASICKYEYAVMYVISRYSYSQAAKLGVVIKPSQKRGKKIDVFDRKGVLLASIGAEGMNDYPTFLRGEKAGKFPAGYAENRRKLYKIRHAKDRKVKNSPGYFADKILW